MSVKINQTGFSIVEALLVLVVIGILGFTGWFVWQSQQKTADTLKLTNKSSASVAKSNSKSKGSISQNDSDYLVIADWGVKFKQPTNGDEIISKSKELTSGVEVYLLTTKSINDLGGYCSLEAEQNSMAVLISREKKPLTDAVDTIPLNDGKPIDGYYYYRSGSFASCITDMSNTQAAGIQTAGLETEKAAAESIVKM